MANGNLEIAIHTYMKELSCFLLKNSFRSSDLGLRNYLDATETPQFHQSESDVLWHEKSGEKTTKPRLLTKRFVEKCQRKQTESGWVWARTEAGSEEEAAGEISIFFFTLCSTPKFVEFLKLLVRFNFELINFTTFYITYNRLFTCFQFSTKLFHSIKSIPNNGRVWKPQPTATNRNQPGCGFHTQYKNRNPLYLTTATWLRFLCPV